MWNVRSHRNCHCRMYCLHMLSRWLHNAAVSHLSIRSQRTVSLTLVVSVVCVCWHVHVISIIYAIIHHIIIIGLCLTSPKIDIWSINSILGLIIRCRWCMLLQFLLSWALQDILESLSLNNELSAAYRESRFQGILQ